MKQIFRIFTLIAVAVLTAGQAWAGSPADLGFIKTGTVTGGTLKFYQDATCQNEIDLTDGKSSNLDSNDLTEGNVYIKATPDWNYTSVNVTFTAQASVTSIQAQARGITRGTDIGIGQAVTVNAVSGKPGIYSLTMPADGKNVTIGATFPEKLKNTEAISYITATGASSSKAAGTVYILDGTETTLGEPGGSSSSPKETWYVCDKNLSYTTFNFSSNCNVNIILADNVEMSVINSNGDAISNSNDSSPDSQDSFGVYGQSKGSDRGALTAKCTSSGGKTIDITGGVIISHCNLTAEGDAYGIYAKGSGKDVIISGAEVTANAGTYGYAIYSKDGGVSITGGTVTADGYYGIRAQGSDKDVTISGAEVIANATAYAIYSDYGGVSITGGTVTAEGDGFGIRANGSGKDVTIIGAEVTANAGTSGFAIYSSNGGVSITGGTVTAEGDGFGIRANGSGKDVTITGDAEVKATATNGYAIDSSKGGVSITGGIVIAEGGSFGIRADGSDKDVTISNAEVTATATDDSAICSGSGDVSITGGTVTAKGKYFGIKTQGSGKDVTISGAKVTATATDDSAIRSYTGGVSITGGTVIAEGTTGITSSDDIVLGWTDANDYIKASSYSVGSNKAVKTADGQRFVAYTPGATESDPMTATAIVSGSIAKENGSYPIDGKTLKPLDGYTVTVADDISLMDGTTAKTPDFTIGTTPYYIYKASTEEDPVTVTLSYSGTDFVTLGGLPEGTTLNAVENQPLQRSFAMPAQDVALTATAVTGLTASGDTYTYDGTAKTPTVKLGDDVFAATNYIVAYTKGGSAVSEAKKVGTYSCTVNGSGSYIGTIATDVAITINPKTVTVTGGISASNKTYDGTTTATLSGTNAVISDMVNGDALSVSATGAFADKDAGSDKTVNISSITLTGNDKDNYVLASTGNQATTSANISKKDLSITADDKNVSYGDAEPTYTASYSGFVSGESESNLSGSLSFSCSYTSSSNTGTYSITPSGYTSSNYNISYNNGTLTVSGATIDYTGGSITLDENGYDITLDEGTGSANPLPSGFIHDLDYSRTLTAPGTGEGDVKIGGEAANLYTVCLPTAPTIGTASTYYTLSGVEGNTLKFIEIDGSPAAFTPYLVAVTGSSDFIVSCSCSNVRFDTNQAAINSKTVDGFTFTGTLTGLSNADAIAAASSGNVTYILQNAAIWGKVVSGSVYLPPFRAFIVGPVLAAGARELSSSFDDGNATAIERIVTTDRDGTEHWYDMNGRRIERPTTKGVYILNGRKEVIK